MSSHLHVEPLVSAMERLPDSQVFESLQFGASVSAALRGVRSLDGAIRFMLARSLQNAIAINAQDLSSGSSASKYFDGVKETMADLRALVRLVQSGNRFVSETLAPQKVDPCADLSVQLLGKVKQFVLTFVDKYPLSPIAASISGTNELILEKLYRDKSKVTMTDLSKHVGHSTASLTGAVDRLEKYPENPLRPKGRTIALVRRNHGSDDRRKIYTRLTSKGEAIASELAMHHEIRGVLRLLDDVKTAE